MRTLGLLLLLTLASCAPEVFPGADARQNAARSRIEGSVVVASKARGNVVLSLFDAARPPPPLGTGRPLAFTVVSAQALFPEGATGGGPFVAPYAFSLVAPGRYLLRGFLDANADFVPWYGVTAEPNRGDVGGALVDGLTRVERQVEVPADSLAPVLGADVSFSEAALLPVDRPAFTTASASLELSGTTPLVTELLLSPIDTALVKQRSPAFLAQLSDADGNGVPDDLNGDGTPDLLWPKVVVRKLADTGLLDENDANRDGLLEPGGADYRHVDPSTGADLPPDGKSDAVVLAAGFDFTPIAAQLFDADGKVKAAPTPVTALRLVVRPRAFDVSTPSAPAPLRGVPTGRYALTVIQSTGQTWRVPNETGGAEAAPRGFTPVEGQDRVLLVK